MQQLNITLFNHQINNQLEDGIFEEIILNEDTKEEASFFIYSLDFSFWEVLEENTSIEHSV